MRLLQLLVFEKHTGECNLLMALVCPCVFANIFAILPGISTIMNNTYNCPPLTETYLAESSEMLVDVGASIVDGGASGRV